MAKVTDIQDKNGATREIQDKDLANRTSQSSIASSDYVLLEDTNGAYHKIAKASFTEAVRGALGSVINSVAKGTDIAKVPVLDSNNDLGMGTLSNLASVLGANEITENDFDTKQRGWRYVNTQTAHNPFTGDDAFGIIRNVNENAFHGYQLYVATMTNQVWIRNLKHKVYENWQRIDNYGTTSLSGLASALGGVYYPSALSDVKSITRGGWYLSDSSTANRPYDGYSFIYASKLQGTNIFTLKAIGNDGQYSFSGVIRDDTVTWLREDNFGCSTPADLASLLGGLVRRSIPDHDINNINTTGMYYASANDQVHNLPGVAYNMIIAICTSNYQLQLAFPVVQNDNLYARIRWENGDWKNWHTLF